ncbi:hypothetical protein ABT034_33585 [Streptomyces sp. NPDC002773]|uniref:hypothetical protein n=1 Tax=Streptomyces sp. NPDC002773 TaxID=3154430 RepID=UPI00331D3B96
MALYAGTLPTRLLNDQQIRPGSYRKWKHVARDFGSRSKDREIMAGLLASLPTEGQRKPILLGVDDRSHSVYVSDGHHRALALMQLDAIEFTFRWCWIRSFTVDHQSAPFPYHLLGL